MCDKKIGGSYQCRICGDIHGCFPCNQKVLPLQAVQISIENIEDFFAGLSMSVETRKMFEGSFKELRKILKVSKEKIYSEKFLPDEEKLKEGEDKAFEYNPTRDDMEKASTIISRMYDFAVNNVYVTKLQEEPMMTAISSLKNEVLKK